MEFFKRSTLIIVSGILAIGFILAASIVTYGFMRTRTQQNGVVAVTGSAKQEIKSDFAYWKGSFSSQAATLKEVYDLINKDKGTVEKYLKPKISGEDTMSFSAIQTTTLYERTGYGENTSVIVGYRLTQNVEITSADVDKAMDISKQSTELINNGVAFSSETPQFYYTKLAELKIEMLSRASEDARKRAEAIADKTGASITGVKSDRMGVFQITPLYSEAISDYGINDTTSINKEIMAVMNCEFYSK